MLPDDDAPRRGARTIVIAPPPEAGLITGFLNSQKLDDGSPVFSVMAREQEIGPGASALWPTQRALNAATATPTRTAVPTSPTATATATPGP